MDYGTLNFSYDVIAISVIILTLNNHIFPCGNIDVADCELCVISHIITSLCSYLLSHV